MDINEILIKWGLSDIPVKQIYSSAWQIGDDYILKSGVNLDWLNNNLSVIKALSESNIPVAEIIKTVDSQDYLIKDNTYFFLSKKIKGNHITDIYSDNYKELSYSIGQVISRLHIAFRQCQSKLPCYDNNFYEEIIGWVSQTFQDKKIVSIPKYILDECTLELREFYPRLPRQLIHRDIHLGNMLFEDNKLTGYIDFDLSQINARIFDLCYMLSGFLIDNIKDETKTEKWFDIMYSLVNGYSSTISLTHDEKKAIPMMMVAIEILFVAYFTNMNDIPHADGAAEIALWLWKNKEKISFK